MLVDHPRKQRKEGGLGLAACGWRAKERVPTLDDRKRRCASSSPAYASMSTSHPGGGRPRPRWHA